MNQYFLKISPLHSSYFLSFPYDFLSCLITISEKIVWTNANIIL